MTSTPPSSLDPSAPDVTVAPSDASDSASASCDDAGYPPLEDYSAITAGARFSLVVRREPSGAWVPITPLRMPLHHASTIVFDPSLDAMIEERERGIPVKVLAVGLGRRSIEHDPRRHAWFATYAARPERACPVR
jgi:hypothetical protein